MNISIYVCMYKHMHVYRYTYIYVYSVTFIHRNYAAFEFLDRVEFFSVNSFSVGLLIRIVLYLQ